MNFIWWRTPEPCWEVVDTRTGYILNKGEGELPEYFKELYPLYVLFGGSEKQTLFVDPEPDRDMEMLVERLRMSPAYQKWVKEYVIQLINEHIGERKDEDS